MKYQNEQVIDWHGRQAEFFAGIGYAPGADDEEKHRAMLQRQIERTQKKGGYLRDRQPAAIARLFGVWPDEVPHFFQMFLGGLSFADLCCGESVMAQEAKRLFQATEVAAYDIDERSVQTQVERGITAKVLDVTTEQPVLESYDVTFSTYGASFWAETSHAARKSIANQAAMTRTFMLTGPIADTRNNLNIVQWGEFSDAVRYQRYIGWHCVDEVLSLSQNGFEVSFPACIEPGPKNSGTHSLIAART